MKTIIKIVITSFLATSVTSIQANDDTDIYFPAESVSTSQNVMFIMDVSGSMRREVGDTGITRFEAMKDAFNNILNTVSPTINVGLMNFGSTGSDRNNFAQGVKFPITPLTANARTIMEEGLPLNNDGSVNWNANNMPEPTSEMTVFDFLPEITNSWTPSGWTPLVDSIYEAALYFRGEKVAWGVGPLEENGNQWVAHPSTYTGSPGAWDATACATTWTERLPQGVIPAEYRCPIDPANPASPGTYANCAATASECVIAPGVAVITSLSSGYVNSDVRNYSKTIQQSGSWDYSGGQSISSSGNHIYEFTVTQEGSITMNLWDANGNDDDAYLYLLDSQNNILAEDDDSGSNYNSRIQQILAVGDYKLVAATYAPGEVGDYGISVQGYVSNLTTPSGIGQYEIGGTWNHSGGQSHTSSSNPKYYFTVTQDAQVTIKVSSTGSVYPFVYLLDDQGNYLDDEDTWGNYYSQLQYNLTAGTYQVVAGTYSVNKSGDFEIEISGHVSEFPATGNGGQGYQIEGTWTNPSGGQDPTSASNPAFDFTLDSNGSVQIELDGSSNDEYLYLLDDSGSVIAEDGDSGNGDEAQITQSLNAGSYSIVAGTDNTSVTGAYTLTLTGDVSDVIQLNNGGSGTGSAGNKVAICHIPPGNPDNAHTIIINRSALHTHESHHDDYIGVCGSGISELSGATGTCLYTMCSGAATTEPTYISPVQSECQSNAIILLSDGHPESGSSVTVNPTYDKVVTNSEWSGGLADIFRGLSCEVSPEGLPRGRCGPELTAYLATHDNASGFEGDQTIQTYTIGLGLGQGSAAENYLKSLSTTDDPNTAGTVEGYYSATDESTLITAFSEILSELELNSTTTAFSNPGYSIVAKAGLNHEDSVFIPTFEVGNNAVWKGNLKKFKLVNSNDQRQIRGQNDQNAVTELGAFTVGAFDYWSTSDIADGTNVAKGGTASLLNPPTRNLYSDLSCSAGVICNLTADNNELSITNVSRHNSGHENHNHGVSNQDLGLSNENEHERKKYICFIRGYEDYDQSSGECSGAARKHMGDMLHFEPLVVTYNRDHDDRNDSTHLQIIFAGTNEGYLHAFDADSGEEVFAFMPEDLLKNIKPQFDDNEYRGHKYGVDGFANVWVNDVDEDGIIEPSGENGVSGDEDDDHVYLYFGLRRGGNLYYALDVTDPETPKLMWKIEGANSGDFQYLGQTWSRPYLAQIHTSATDATLKPVLVFSGGYDAENQDKPFAERDISADEVGADIFIVDANSGDLIWSLKKNTSSGLALTHSVPGGVRILDMDKDGAIDRMYFADVVGNVWRLELDTDFYDGETDSNPDSLYDLDDARLIKVASLGKALDDSDDTTIEPRKFFNEPDVSLSRKDGVTSLLIAIGSGDRTAPLGTGIVDRFYVLEDSYVTSLVPSPLPSSYLITENNLAVVAIGTDDEGATTLSNGLAGQNVLARSEKGWYLQFDAAGEKVLSNSLTNHGKVIFTTLVPDVYANVTNAISSCNIPATQGRAYVLDILEGNADVDLDGDGGAPDNDDLFTVVSANEIPGGAQLVFNEPLSANGSACTEGNCIQNVDLRSGKKLSQVMSYNAGVLESVFWSKPQEKQE